MMTTAIRRQEGVAAALRAVEHPRQIDPRLADQPAPKLDRKAGRRQQRGRVAERIVERHSDMVDVERAFAWAAGDVEAAAKVELGNGDADRLGDFSSVGDGEAVDL